MDCKCESCARKDCPERTKQDDLRIVISCLDYVKHEMTNADSIRAMSDEELANALFRECTERESCYGCFAYKDNGECPGSSVSAWLEWLKQPVEEVNE